MAMERESNFTIQFSFKHFVANYIAVHEISTNNGQAIKQSVNFINRISNRTKNSIDKYAMDIERVEHILRLERIILEIDRQRKKV